MNYIKHYNLLINKAFEEKQDRLSSSTYYENHHIIPKCLGGCNNAKNLVPLTGREHYIAHLLLWKMYPEEDGLKHAAILMGGRFNDNRNNSRLYESLRKEYAASLKDRMTGANNPFYGRKHSEEANLAIEMAEIKHLGAVRV